MGCCFSTKAMMAAPTIRYVERMQGYVRMDALPKSSIVDQELRQYRPAEDTTYGFTDNENHRVNRMRTIKQMFSKDGHRRLVVDGAQISAYTYALQQLLPGTTAYENALQQVPETASKAPHAKRVEPTKRVRKGRAPTMREGSGVRLRGHQNGYQETGGVEGSRSEPVCTRQRVDILMDYVACKSGSLEALNGTFSMYGFPELDRDWDYRTGKDLEKIKLFVLRAAFAEHTSKKPSNADELFEKKGSFFKAWDLPLHPWEEEFLKKDILSLEKSFHIYTDHDGVRHL